LHDVGARATGKIPSRAFALKLQDALNQGAMARASAIRRWYVDYGDHS
jgi:hypothetical protein